MPKEDLKGYDGPRRASHDDGRLVWREMLDESGDIVGIDVQSVLVVLRASNDAAGESSSVVGRDSVLVLQVLGQWYPGFEAAICTRDAKNQWTSAAHFVVQNRTRNFDFGHFEKGFEGGLWWLMNGLVFGERKQVSAVSSVPSIKTFLYLLVLL